MFIVNMHFMLLVISCVPSVCVVMEVLSEATKRKHEKNNIFLWVVSSVTVGRMLLSVFYNNTDDNFILFHHVVILLIYSEDKIIIKHLSSNIQSLWKKKFNTIFILSIDCACHFIWHGSSLCTNEVCSLVCTEV